MKCRSCKNEIDDRSIFCMYCGEKVIRTKREPDNFCIPKPRRTKTGYAGQVMVNGQRILVKGKTEAEYRKNAAEMKKQTTPPAAEQSLKKLIRKYIDDNDAVLSPSTISGYEVIYEHRFKDYMDLPVRNIDFQKMVKEEAKEKSAKTVFNAWSLVSSSLKHANLDVPKVTLPSSEEYDGDFLDHKQIITFLKAIRGNRSEAAAILALHSLRASELFHVSREDIKDGYINVSGATVRVRHKGRIDKETNKTKKSKRSVPIIIPRITEVIPESGKVVTVTERQAYKDITSICIENGLPACSLHDLRRTFASLAAYLKWHEESICAVGGWNPGSPIVHNIYIKCSKTETDEDAEIMKNYLKIT